MGKLVSYRSFDWQPVDTVPVIASFDTEGHIVPLYVRLQGDSRKIDSYWYTARFAGVIEFHCQIKLEERLVPLLLTYYHEEQIWTVPQILDSS